ncbi:amidinotransferase [Kitasatospora kifunensis]|uniref:Glycine amidinotransferase n=1 Tax=Kitasatospora kifunensis TaxID=58351 RepID=A0A7W7R156_KITKI|nr:amidinotransferase [Kitasatospora kifunensis]MBB4923463.1 glycine amidinotransferase [Kitasatospora kifunensis]
MSESVARPDSPVSAYNEWDPLEEVIVGIVDGAHFPPYDIEVSAPLSAEQRAVFRENAGRPFPADGIAAARDELDQLVDILGGEGVKVRRPEPRDHSQSYSAPGWSSTGLYDAMPRDMLLVVGQDIIEAPMSWRSRHHAASAFRPLLKEYFHGGARWSSPPKPELTDELYVEGWTDQPEGEPFRSVITEFEPTFDAADFVRCGRDIFGQRSHTTNAMGIEWLRRHLGDTYRVHELTLADDHPMHIDASLMPLAPGKLLIHPDRVPEVPAIFKDWEVRTAPLPVIPDGHPLYMTSKWINMNVLMIDEHKMVVEAQDEPMRRFAEDWGMEAILCPFRNFNSLGGSFHCATVDVRRRGELQSYF